MASDNIHFVTGRLAEPALRHLLPELSKKVGFDYSIQVMPITVAALMTPSWIAARIKIPHQATKIIVPGHCNGDLSPLKAKTDLPIEQGPKDLRRLAEHFGQTADRSDYGNWDIEIIAEINHAPRLSIEQIVRTANHLKKDGATLIDVGCEPNSTWNSVGQCVAALQSEGHRCSIDSLNPLEIAPAVEAGAELVLSVNSSNRQHAAQWNCEVVVIPDNIRDIHSMEDTMELLDQQNVPFRIDPILEPIGLGFTQSLERYMQARRRWPHVEMMMGIGNITELTDVDSAGINVLLLAICQELKIRSILTTQVINWARTSVKECDLARRLVHYAVNQSIPPKHLTDQLVLLRDEKLFQFGAEQIEELASQIKDNNYRIISEADEIHLLGSRQHFHDADPFLVFDQLMATAPTNVDPSHAFYLGYEMCKAMTAMQLGKQYTQDEALDWGFLTQPETDRHRLKKKRTDRIKPIPPKSDL
ncbi:MAG: dihydropteroate synthase [Planctomycetaceae bacterium]|nr:dihydropteroate synthase [Planctomycetaceae bacterium]